MSDVLVNVLQRKAGNYGFFDVAERKISSKSIFLTVR